MVPFVVVDVVMINGVVVYDESWNRQLWKFPLSLFTTCIQSGVWFRYWFRNVKSYARVTAPD